MRSNHLEKSLFAGYENYRETLLNPKLIRYQDLQPCYETIKTGNSFTVQLLGKSVEGRDINVISFGTGKIKVLAWSQMHGDEPTATAALFDLIKFFSADDSFNSTRSSLIENLNFHFIPLLNPDGAELYKRGNSFNIDLNRDAEKLESHESKILWDYAAKIQPEFGFNLHDQNSYYTAGRTDNHATISLLAPPSDHVKSINYTREKSMQVILKIFETLNNFIPDQIARYNDDHEPRSFGDTFVKKGISTILIESGYYKSDPDKEFVRKLNFISLISAFNSIAERDFEKTDYTKYFSIPENQELLFDLILRNLTLNYKEEKFKIDIGINRKKKWNSVSKEFIYTGTIAELGDLSLNYGIEDYDLNNHQISWTEKLAVDEPADFVLEGKEKLVIKNGFLYPLGRLNK
ncbi:MAG: hypothetical protein CVV24_03170 [Ignavibacteriae bacterium HGW-Ignavibacteriae-3]|nr:MAG: hypothetical protein CVV24_03170 [Ignavibacteriae bacterium HGW-Ignavibacteriae-3]